MSLILAFNQQGTAELRARWSRVIYRLRSVYLGPLIIAFFTALLLGSVPQMHEVYRNILADHRWVHGTIGLALVILLCLQIDCWQRQLGAHFIDQTYPTHASLQVDRALLRWNAWGARIASVLPLAGLGVGFAIAAWDMMFPTADQIAALAYRPLSTMLTGLTFYATLAGLTAGLAVLAVYASDVLKHRLKEPWQTARLFRTYVVAVSGVVCMSATFLPILGVADDYIGDVAFHLGPLSSVAIVIITSVAWLSVLSFVSIWIRLPILTIVFSVFLIWFTLDLNSSGTEILSGSGSATDRSVKGTNPTVAFDTWIGSRPGRNASVRYPVFIVAAPGGGIYAAASTLGFLSSLEEECPGFSDHIFAISGVSGGAVGASVYAGLMAQPSTRRTNDAMSSDCGTPSEHLSPGVKQILFADHLSPALLQIWPDIVRKIFGYSQASSLSELDRSRALEHSFACALAGQPTACPFNAAKRKELLLHKPFADFGKDSPRTPSLILNTTWSETGYRVAFAPFLLSDIGSALAFPTSTGSQKDFMQYGVSIKTRTGQELSSISLIEAAFASARFPGIVPALSYAVDDKLKQRRQWNFVDGGYSDNSGATTALELYTALLEHTQTEQFKQKHGRVDLRLIILTEAASDLNLGKVGGGSTLNDTVAPISALLNVRSQVANRAVKRALETVKDNAHVVNLHQTTFDLPLGWNISARTMNVIEKILGRSSLCNVGNSAGAPTDLITVHERNSCVKSKITDLLRKPPAP